VDLSLAAAARLLRKEVDSAENRRLVEEFLSQIPAGETRGKGSS
jgi:F0F1-type ATP synthase membrane subunit b/b'